MSSKSNLDMKFLEAVARVNEHSEPFPADFLLRLYAYYKKATNNYSQPSSRKPIINAFKTNALFQAQGINQEMAKKEYIKLVDNYFIYRK